MWTVAFLFPNPPEMIGYFENKEHAQAARREMIENWEEDGESWLAVIEVPTNESVLDLNQHMPHDLHNTRIVDLSSTPFKALIKAKVDQQTQSLTLENERLKKEAEEAKKQLQMIRNSTKEQFKDFILQIRSYSQPI